MKKWNKKNALWMLLYAVIYVITSVAVCVLGSVHPILFVCYQITAGLLVTGAAACLSMGMILTFLAIRDANLWHCVPVVLIAVIAEIIRYETRYKSKGNLIAVVIMSFSTFGYYGQIWFNRDYTYECAVDEMPAGYADTLMDSSPAWAFPLVIIAGIAVAVLNYAVTSKLFRFEKD